MTVIKRHSGWVYYIGDDGSLDPARCGKWMYFFASVMKVRDLCRRAVNDGVVVEAKHSDASRGVACFYLNCDDEAAHRRTIEFFVEHGLIRKTKAGRFYDISFKLDSQTESGEYGSGFQAEIRLSDFIDLDTGKWLNREG